MLAGVVWLGGEFAFVGFSEAVRVKLLEDVVRVRLVAIVGVSMALTPLLLIAMTALMARSRPAKAKPAQAFDDPGAEPTGGDGQHPQVLIAGMGRFGQIVARLLTAQRIPYVALEHSPEQVEDMRRFGSRIFYGDPTRPELLRAAGAHHVKAFVIAVDDTETNIKATRLIRRMYPKAMVFARARNRQHAWRLMDLGAEAFRETFGSSLHMGEKVLEALGLPPEMAADHAARFREHDEKLLRAQHLVYDDDAAVVQTARDARADLARLFEADISDVDGAGDDTGPEQATPQR
jgi:voltage-gated potassium channel Kch